MPWPITLPFVKSTLTVALEIYIFGILMDSGVYVTLLLSMQENRNPSTFFRDVTEKKKRKNEDKEMTTVCEKRKQLTKENCEIGLRPKIDSYLWTREYVYGRFCETRFPKFDRELGLFLEIFRSREM